MVGMMVLARLLLDRAHDSRPRCYCNTGVAVYPCSVVNCVGVGSGGVGREVRWEAGGEGGSVLGGQRRCSRFIPNQRTYFVVVSRSPPSNVVEALLLTVLRIICPLA